MENREALVEHYRSTRAGFMAAIEGLDDDAMVEPSIDGWSVKDHMAHLALWDDVRASEVERISAGHDTAWRMTTEQDAAYSAMGYAMRRELPLEQVRWEFAQSRARLLQAIASATDRALDPSLYGEAPVKSSHEVQHAEWIRRWRAERA